jgi:hypothetical protein
MSDGDGIVLFDPSSGSVLRRFKLSLSLRNGKSVRTGNCANEIFPYGEGKLVLRWTDGDSDKYSFGNGPARMGDVIAVTDNGTAITWSTDAVVGFGSTIKMRERPIGTWAR